ncbi:odorant receptor coreceptor-like isoform X2 [Toxorhynchites rutilus septentrionalis]|uniref:odorant receptor coreceptor-like isoform X2 n=1 Tax=Toxorhynchites rutilus septentrionalis TaxID=329112 RepID=UPI00247ABA30|nr:odorant receptor coreceptor-like isoform X2 [Toxorhynchites rutilus septentrionalis]
MGNRTEKTDYVPFMQQGCIELLENCANLAMMVQMMTWALAWVSLVICLDDGFDMMAWNRIIMITVITIDTFIFCDFGTQLKDESFAVSTAMYNQCQWYNLPVDVQKSLSLLLHRSQKKDGITGAKFFYVDREQFARVAQTSYSMYLVLKERL